ncbi:MAG TPA: c-type cytochrome [Saprospiraceae bacterium]|jgi:cytochrome c
MKNYSIFLGLVCIAMTVLLSQCTQSPSTAGETPYEVKATYGGYDTPEKWGEHLVTICGCHDCHSPKKMGPMGPEVDSTRLLSGHPAGLPPADIDRKLLESKGIIATDMLTAWIGPWGISYTANLTPDETGLGNWQESNFLTAIREGKLKGISTSRPLLPPMPWDMYKHMSDDELKAIFAYLKTVKPIKNIVPEPTPPAMAAAK